MHSQVHAAIVPLTDCHASSCPSTRRSMCRARQALHRYSSALNRHLILLRSLVLCMQVYAIPHPLIRHWLAIARNAATPPALFRGACAELGRLLIYEAVREFLPTLTGEVDTPVDVADVEFVDPTKPVKVSGCLHVALRGFAAVITQAEEARPAPACVAIP